MAILIFKQGGHFAAMEVPGALLEDLEEFVKQVGTQRNCNREKDMLYSWLNLIFGLITVE